MVLNTDDTIIMPEFLYEIIREKSFNEKVLLGLKGAQLPRIGFDYFSSIQIQIPPLPIQQQIVNRMEQEQQLVNANKELIKIYEQKIKDEINKLWQPAAKDYPVQQEKFIVAAEE
jgi:type I restriction enzyme M protein